MVKATKLAEGEISLPSFKDGEAFKVKPLTYGGMKAVGRVGDGEGAQVDAMDITLNETLKRSFPDVTLEEIDDIEQPDIVTLSTAIAKANGDDSADFTTPPNMTK